MTKKDFVKLGQALANELPVFTVNGPILFIAPATRVVRGLSFDGSSFSRTSLYVDIFAMPLCVLQKHITLGYGDRVREHGVSDKWDKDMVDLVPRLTAAIRDFALPQLSKLDSLASLIEAKAAKAYPNAIRDNEALGFMLAREGRVEESLRHLDKIIRQHDPMRQWEVEVADRANKLLNLLVESPLEAQKQLETWEAETAHNIGFAA